MPAWKGEEVEERRQLLVWMAAGQVLLNKNRRISNSMPAISTILHHTPAIFILQRSIPAVTLPPSGTKKSPSMPATGAGIGIDV